MPDDHRPKLAFYQRLTRAQQREYDRSDRLGVLPLRAAPELAQLTDELVRALQAGEGSLTRKTAQALADQICRRLRRKGVAPRPAPRIRVLKARPRLADGEFHGLYTLHEDGRCEIRVWMLTAANRRVVRPRTFLRTLLHELVHHFDMTLLDLPSSFHTIGFHARESSLLRVLEASGAEIPGGRRKEGGKPVNPKPMVTRHRDSTAVSEPHSNPKATTELRRRFQPETTADGTQLDLFGRDSK